MECKDGIKEIKNQLKDILDFMSEIKQDYSFFVKYKDGFKEMARNLKEEFNRVSSCPIKAVKVEDENGNPVCKEVSGILDIKLDNYNKENINLGNYVPVENIVSDMEIAIDSGAISKFEQKLKELQKYVDSIIGGYSCPIPEEKKSEENNSDEKSEGQNSLEEGQNISNSNGENKKKLKN